MRNERTDKRTAETKRQQIVSLGDTPTSSASHRPALRKLETSRLESLVQALSSWPAGSYAAQPWAQHTLDSPYPRARMSTRPP